MNQINENISAGAVMIVDDNNINRELLSDFLLAKHFSVFSFATANEFLARVGLDCPDVILMDIKLPGMDGLEAIRRLRAMPDLTIAAIPVIAVTALAMPGDREICLDAGANKYMEKPVILRNLMQLIEGCIKQEVC